MNRGCTAPAHEVRTGQIRSWCWGEGLGGALWARLTHCCPGCSERLSCYHHHRDLRGPRGLEHSHRRCGTFPVGSSWVEAWGTGPWERQVGRWGPCGGRGSAGRLCPTGRPEGPPGPISVGVCVGGSTRASSLWLEVRGLGSGWDFHSLSLSFHPRRHVRLLARAQGRRPTGRGHPGVPPGADGDHEGPAAASPGPSPAAPR